MGIRKIIQNLLYSGNFRRELYNRVLFCCVLHTLFCVAFFSLRVWEMGVFNIFSILLYLSLFLYIYFNKSPKVSVIDHVSSLEYILHTIFVVYFTGFELGFQFVIFALAIPVVIFAEKKGGMRFNYFKLFLSAVIYSGLLALCNYDIIVPKYTFSKMTGIISTFVMYLIMFIIISMEIVIAFQNYESYMMETQRVERENMQKMNDILRKVNNNIAGVIEARDTATGEHTDRTTSYVKNICEELVKEKKFTDILNSKMIDYIVDSAALHDIGKIKTPDAILNKPGKLTPEEFDTIKNHTTDGGNIIRNIFQGIDDEIFQNVAFDIAMYHHERWDGTGYPRGLKGEEIPLCARIMAVADVYDALISIRVYKPAFTKEEAIEILRADSGTHFDPNIVEAFLNTI